MTNSEQFPNHVEGLTEVVDRNCPKHGPYRTLRIAALKASEKPCPGCVADGSYEAERKAQADAKEDQRKAAENAAHARRREQRAANIDTLCERAGVPKRHTGKTFGSYTPSTPRQKAARDAMDSYAASLDDNVRAGRCAALFGPAGTGKTHLATALVRDALLEGFEAKFVPVAELVREVRCTYQPGSTTTEAEVLRKYAMPDLLVLDDIGAGKGSDHERGVLVDLIAMRYNDVLPTVLTTNLSTAELKEYLAERTSDRLRENGLLTIQIDGESIRAKLS